MKTSKQIAADRAAASEAISTVQDFRMQHLLALGTGILVAWALSNLWNGWTSAVIAVMTYVIAYPLYVHMSQRRRGAKPSYDQIVPRIIRDVIIVTLALVIYHYANGRM